MGWEQKPTVNGGLALAMAHRLPKTYGSYHSNPKPSSRGGGLVLSKTPETPDHSRLRVPEIVTWLESSFLHSVLDMLHL